MTKAPLWLAMGAFAALAATASAQGRAGDSLRTGPVGRPQSGGRAKLGGRQGQAKTPMERQALEGRVRQAFAGVVRRQLNLDNQKMRQLQQTDAKYDRQRRELNRDEMQARMALKTSMEDSVGHDQNKIAQNLDRLLQAQHRRADLLEAEQKDLSSFLTPMQRAQYLSLKERMTRRLLDGPKNAVPDDTTPPPPER